MKDWTVYLSAPQPDVCDPEGLLQFTITYAGELRATQRDPLEGRPPKHTLNRRHIRKCVHHQMKRLWDVMPALNGTQRNGGAFIITDRDGPATTVPELAAKHDMFGHNFVPLVTEDLELFCDLEILFLRPDDPGGVVWGGDIDNRVKTLLDALSIPNPGEGYSELTPAEDEQPFYCLLQDDKLITGLSVKTERLLEPVDGKYDEATARLFINVSIRPSVMTPSNLHFG